MREEEQILYRQKMVVNGGFNIFLRFTMRLPAA